MEIADFTPQNGHKVSIPGIEFQHCHGDLPSRPESIGHPESYPAQSAANVIL